VHLQTARHFGYKADREQRRQCQLPTTGIAWTPDLGEHVRGYEAVGEVLSAVGSDAQPEEHRVTAGELDRPDELRVIEDAVVELEPAHSGHPASSQASIAADWPMNPRITSDGRNHSPLSRYLA
jgi:hypothetical protein